MRLEQHELKTFQAVVEANGFNRAAEHLNVSQSAVSQTIGNLEAKLDIPLIRRGKQLALTDAGRRLLSYANEVLQEEQQVLEDISRLKEGDRQILNLAINSTINRFYAPQLLIRFSQTQQASRIKVTELPSRNLIYTILSGRAELAIGPFQKNMDAFMTIPLYQETRHLVVSTRHSQYHNMIKGEDKSLKQSPLITSFLDTPEMRPSLQRLRDRFQSIWEISSLSLRIHLVDQGLGAAYIDSKLLQEHPVCRDFVEIKGLAFGSIERQVGLYYKAGKILTSSEEKFIKLCMDFWGLQ